MESRAGEQLPPTLRKMWRGLVRAGEGKAGAVGWHTSCSPSSRWSDQAFWNMQTEILLLRHLKWPTQPGGSLHSYGGSKRDLPHLPCTFSTSPDSHLLLKPSSQPEVSASSFTPTCLTLPRTVPFPQIYLLIPQALFHSGRHHLELRVFWQLLSFCPSLGFPSSVSWAAAGDLPTVLFCVLSQLNLAMPPLVFIGTTPWPDFQGTV